MGDWISTEDKLPDVPAFLGVTKAEPRNVKLFWKRNWGGGEYTVGGTNIARNIAWWTPLPEPPGMRMGGYLPMTEEMLGEAEG